MSQFNFKATKKSCSHCTGNKSLLVALFLNSAYVLFATFLCIQSLRVNKAKNMLLVISEQKNRLNSDNLQPVVYWALLPWCYSISFHHSLVQLTLLYIILRHGASKSQLLYKWKGTWSTMKKSRMPKRKKEKKHNNWTKAAKSFSPTDYVLKEKWHYWIISTKYLWFLCNFE